MSVETEIKSINGKTICDSTARSAASAKYEKPSGGIPESDLSETVKAKLNRTESDPTVPEWAKEPQKPTYTAAEVGALPSSTAVPAPVQKTTGMTQAVGMDSDGRLWTSPGSGGGTGGGGGITEETDPTVPAWAKSPTKPTYTAAEVGALPADTEIPDELADLTSDSTHRTVTDAEKTEWNAAYQKPSSGIPKTDLASAVQSSLGKADSAQPKTIADSDGYFTTDTVEGALAEIGAELAGVNTLIGSGVIA